MTIKKKKKTTKKKKKIIKRPSSIKTKKKKKISKNLRKPEKKKIDPSKIKIKIPKIPIAKELANQIGKIRKKYCIDGTPFGAPTKYHPDFCQLVIQHMAGGFSFESFAGVIGVCKKTLYNWRDENPDFLHAGKTGKELSRLYWESLGNTISRSPTNFFNGTVFKFNMTNRFSEDWKNRVDQKTEHSGGLTHSKLMDHIKGQKNEAKTEDQNGDQD